MNSTIFTFNSMKNFSLKIFWFWPKNSSDKYVFYQKINAHAPKFGVGETPFFWFLMGYRTYSMSHALQDETVEKFFEVLRNFQIVPGRHYKIKKINYLKFHFWDEKLRYFSSHFTKWYFEMRIFFLTSKLRNRSEIIFSQFRS